MLRRRHVRRLLADRDAARGRHWHLASGVAGTRIAGRDDAPRRFLHSVAPPSSLSLPATNLSPLQAATYAFCRQKCMRRHNATSDRNDPFMPITPNVL
jgi:hypothetical protein